MMKVGSLVIAFVCGSAAMARAAQKECDNLRRASNGLNEAYKKSRGLGPYSSLTSSERLAASNEAFSQARLLKHTIEVIDCDDDDLKNQVSSATDQVYDGTVADETWHTGLKMDSQNFVATAQPQPAPAPSKNADSKVSLPSTCQKPFDAYLAYLQSVEASSCASNDVERIRSVTLKDKDQIQFAAPESSTRTPASKLEQDSGTKGP